MGVCGDEAVEEQPHDVDVTLVTRDVQRRGCEWVGVNMTGYLAMFICTSLMRFMALFLLASLEPSGFSIRNRVWRLTGRSLGLLPGVGSAGVGESADQDDISRRG